MAQQGLDYIKTVEPYVAEWEDQYVDQILAVHKVNDESKQDEPVLLDAHSLAPRFIKNFIPSDKESLEDLTPKDKDHLQHALEKLYTAILNNEDVTADSLVDLNAKSKTLIANLQQLDGMTKENIDNLQKQIFNIVLDNLVFTMSGSPATVFVNAVANVTLTAKSNDENTLIEIFDKDGNSLGTGVGTSLSKSTSYTPSIQGNTAFKAKATLNGVSKEVTANVKAVHGVYSGAGTSESAASNKASVRSNPSGTYSVNVSANGQYVYFAIPNYMNITKATMSGFDMPFNSPTTINKEGISYKLYKSVNTYDKGNLSIVLTGTGI